MSTDKRDAILEASIELFAERGYSDTPTAAIARRARVAEGTVFHYFHSKREILEHIIGRVLDRYLEGADAATQQPQCGFDEVMGLISLHFSIADKNPKEFLVVLRDLPVKREDGKTVLSHDITLRAEKMMSYYRRALERGMADGSIEKMPVPETASVILGTVIGILRQQFFSPRKICDFSAIRTEAITFCARAIKTQKEHRC